MAIVKITTQLVRVRDDLPRIIRDHKRWDNAVVAIGWDAYSGKYPNGTLVSQVAIWNEFGTHNEDGSVRSPARPFMRPAYQENKAALDTLRRDVVTRVNEGKLTPEKGLNILGYRMWQWIRGKILSNVPPPLASAATSKNKRPSTLERKRRAGRPAVTLIDTRRMLDTLTYKIYLGRFSPTAQTTAQAQQAGANARRITGDTAAKQSAKAQALAAKVMTAKQVKREKKILREALQKAKAAKKREGQRLAKQAKVAKAKAKAKQQREAKRARKAVAAKKAHDKKVVANYERKEKRNAKRAGKEKKALEARVAKYERKQGKKYVKQVKHALKVKAKKEKTMAARDKRQAKGLSRIKHLTPKQKEAKAAREKLVKANKARLRSEKRAEKREIKAEKLAKVAAQKAARKTSLSPKTKRLMAKKNRRLGRRK